MRTASLSQSRVIRFLFWGPLFCPPGSHLSFHPGLTVPPSPLAPLHLILIGCHCLRESPTATSSWQILWGTTQIPLQGGIWFVFGLDLNLSSRAAPGYIHKLRKLGRSSRESTGEGAGALVPFTCYFSTDRVQANSSCLLLTAPASFLSPGVHSRSQSHAEHHLAHCSDCLSLE